MTTGVEGARKWEKGERKKNKQTNKQDQKKHLHSQRLSLRAKRTFHAVLLPVTLSTSVKDYRPVVQGGKGGGWHQLQQVSLTTVRSPDTKGRGHQPVGLLLRDDGEGGGSLLFAGGELADLAGCGDSFARGVGGGGGAAFGFGLAVQ